MTSTEVTPITPGEAERQKRAAYIDGLRALADILESNPEVPLPWTGASEYSEIAISDFLHVENPREALAAAARAFRGVKWDKGVREDATYGNYFDLTGRLHGLYVRLTANRDAVCERVVTGTREVTETVKDPEALAAVPEIEVTRVVEDVQWACGSVLAPAVTPESPAAA
jgi:hypothetical protein